MPRQRFPIRCNVRSIVFAPEVIKWKIVVFHGDGFSLTTFLIREIRKYKWHYRACLVEPVRNIYFLTLKGQFQTLTWGQVRSRSGHGPSTLICTYFKVAWRAKSFGTICVFWYPFCRDLSAKNELRPHLTSFDLGWTPRDPRSSVTSGLSQMGWVAMILKELGGFCRFMRNGKHFHIFP